MDERLTQHSKLADWDDDDPQSIQDTSSRWDKVVILKHMFTLQELEVRVSEKGSRIHVHSMLTMTACRRTRRPSLI